MQTTVTNGEITTVFDVAEFNVNVGESAKIDVNEAVNYIKTGQAEVQETVDEGIADFNQNASEKTAEFNSNATNKTTAFNENASSKTADFNSNASAKTGDFNTNATSKNTAFNDNATSKTNTFNQNATDKTTAFNNNASEKTTAFNDNYTEKKAVIDSQVELAKDWATKTDGKVDGTDYSAKHYAEQTASLLSTKQDTLVSGSNIKTINNNSILGSGNLDIDGLPSQTGQSGKFLTTNGSAASWGSPTIPTVNDATLTIQKNSTDVATFTANASSNVTANISVPTDTGDLTNNAGFITGITSTDVTNALGYTPYDSSNPSGYTSNVGTVTSVNNTSPDANGNVTLSIPAAQVNSDWNAVSGVAQILNKPTLGTMASESASDYTKTSGLASVATSGSYADLTNKPTDFTGADGTNAGSQGFVPAPTATDNDKFLKGDGTWAAPSSSSVSWGNITGTLSNQTDLNNALSGKADTDLSNLTSTGQNIANWSSNVTNCITEIPQDIKLELNNGTLTLKAGSKVYVPNGSGVFDVVTISSDTTITAPYAESQYFIFLYTGNNALRVFGTSQCFSGTSAPSGQTYMMWYDTTNNSVKVTENGGSTWTGGYSFPLCIVSTDGTQITSIDQVFNGFGYIGSTVFALPNVKGLIPNGRNADGSLKNISFEISSVITSTLSYGEGEYYLGYIDGGYIGFLREIITHYLKDENLILDDITGIKHNDWMFFGSFYANSSNKITSFTPKTPFHALDYNDSSTISGWSMPSSRYIDLTLLASGSQYTAPANGWFYFSKNGTAGGQFAVFEAASDGIAGEISGVSYTAGYGINLLRPVKKGITVKLRYTAQGATNYFRFVYGEGENV